MKDIHRLGIICWNTHNEIVEWNPTFLSMSGLENENLSKADLKIHTSSHEQSPGSLDLRIQFQNGDEPKLLSHLAVKLVYKSTTDETLYVGVVEDLNENVNTGVSVKLDEEDFNLFDLLEPQVRFFESKAKQRGLALRMYLDPKAPKILRGRAKILTQIVNLLLERSIASTLRGQVTLSIGLLFENSQNARLRFSVSGSSRYQSSEINQSLSEAQPLIESLEGEMGFQDKGDESSTFWLQLKFTKPPSLKDRRAYLRNTIKDYRD